MLKDLFAWMRGVVELRVPKKVDTCAEGVDVFQDVGPDGQLRFTFIVPKRSVNIAVHDVDSFVTAVKMLYQQRYDRFIPDCGGHPDETSFPKPALVTIGSNEVVATLLPSQSCRRGAESHTQEHSNAPDCVMLKLVDSLEYERLLNYGDVGARVKQADMVREWEDVWSYCTHLQLAEKFRRIENQSRSEVTTGVRRDMGTQEFVIVTDNIPEFVELSVDRWVNYSTIEGLRPKVKVRIVIDRTQPPVVGLVPVPGALYDLDRVAKDTLRRELTRELEPLKIPVVVGNMAT